MSARPDVDLASVAGQLYGALLRARPYVFRRLELTRAHGKVAAFERDRAALDEVDAALVSAADYLESDGG